jgi:hypothetical protein
MVQELPPLTELGHNYADAFGINNAGRIGRTVYRCNGGFSSEWRRSQFTRCDLGDIQNEVEAGSLAVCGFLDRHQ